jgi:hypothetical protein
MKDFDFDEIDRAVSSTMQPKDAPKNDEAAVPVTVSRSEPTSTPPAAKRSSGRFMDVVHPSSDMRSSVPERSTPRPAEKSAPAPVAEKTNSDWPDPLDFHGFTPEDNTETPTPAPSGEEELQSPKPLDSPFLSDAKVEKRPLGAFSEEKPAMAVEPKKEETPLIEAPDEPLLRAETEEEMPEKEPEPTPASELEQPNDELVAPVSITQQYKEQPSTTDQPSGAIFDTEAYHQPLAHPEKKRSGAMIIVWIVALILLGAGIGAGVYFYVLPLL